MPRLFLAYKLKTIKMRTVSFGMNISLDGYCDHTAFNPSEEVMDYFTEMMDGVDLFFFGRVMYQLMFPYWSDVARDQSGTAAENRFAQKFSAIDRVVVSRSLDSGDEKTRIIRSNPAEELLKLKQQPGKKISVDSVSMLPELISAGLIDEFKLIVHPGIVGKGRLLLEPGSLQEKLDLKLIDTIRFKSGSVALHYLKQ
ncbi:Dihydrofolate reductase [Chitinophaga niabensis]|uniref:Dihydrofolate reductase n=2 Tax=Chitinophaga niabensis TaxID=536979 RepID=A0A1N6FY37_9BACT|nr:Dihydrofolate reductase [Chitinophaga niabensis]